jgi:hypothetical protein
VPNTHELTVPLDATTRRMYNLLMRRKEKTIANAAKRSSRVLGEVLREVSLPCMLEDDRAVEFLDLYMTSIERELSTMLKNHGAFKLLLLHRRFPMDLLREQLAHRGSFRIIERIVTLAILKYAGRNTGGVRKGKGPRFSGQWAIDVSARDLEDLLAVTFLSMDFYLCSTSKRTVWKGASLELQDGLFPRVSATSDLRSVMSWYDDRLDNESSLFQHVGLLYDDSSDMSPSEDYLFIPAAVDAAEESLKPFEIHWKNQKILLPNPNFIPGRISTQQFKQFLRLFDSAIRQTYSLSSEQVSVLVDRLTLFLLRRFIEELPMRLYMQSQRGLSLNYLTDFREFCREKLVLGGRTYEPIDPEQFLKLLALEKNETIDLETTHPPKSIYIFRDDDMMVIDLVANATMLAGLLFQAQLSDTERNLKSETFEDEIWNYLSGVKRISQPFPVRKIFRKNDRDIAQVDVSLGKESALFLVECKAYSQSRNLVLGETHAVRNRWRLVEEWIKESKQRAARLAQMPTGDNYSIPSEFTHIVPVVTSAFPEFFFDVSARFMMGKIPIVCTPNEFKGFLDSFSADKLEHLQNAYPIS